MGEQRVPDQQQSNPSLFGYGTAPVDPYKNELVRALQDPRLAMLLAPGMSLLRAPGAMHRALQLIPSMSERGSFNPLVSGGSNVPAQTLRTLGPDAKGFTEQELRADHLERVKALNEFAASMPNFQTGEIGNFYAGQLKAALSPEQRAIFTKTEEGQRALTQEITRYLEEPRMGGGDLGAIERLNRLKGNPRPGFGEK